MGTYLKRVVSKKLEARLGGPVSIAERLAFIIGSKLSLELVGCGDEALFGQLFLGRLLRTCLPELSSKKTGYLTEIWTYAPSE